MNGVCQLVDCDPRERAIVIASERLSEDSGHWFRVAPNHVLTVSNDLEVKVELMGIERHGSALDLLSAWRHDLSMRH